MDKEMICHEQSEISEIKKGLPAPTCGFDFVCCIYTVLYNLLPPGEFAAGSFLDSG